MSTFERAVFAAEDFIVSRQFIVGSLFGAFLSAVWWRIIYGICG